MTSVTNTIDLIPENVLIHVINHPNDFSWKFLAMKIILTRLNMKITIHDGERSVMSECCNELRNLLKKSINVPNSRTDLKQILSLITG